MQTAKVKEVRLLTSNLFFSTDFYPHFGIATQCIRNIEIYKSLTDVNPDFTRNYFSVKEIPYSLRNGSVLIIPSTRSTYYGTNSIHFRACLLWNKLPNTLKESQSLPEFKDKIKAIGKIDCSCTICRSR